MCCLVQSHGVQWVKLSHAPPHPFSYVLRSGMANVKAFFKELSRTVAFVERGGDPRVLQTSLNLRLTGNPGLLGKQLSCPLCDCMVIILFYQHLHCTEDR